MKFSDWVPLDVHPDHHFPQSINYGSSKGILRTCTDVHRFYMHYYMALFGFRAFEPFRKKGDS